MDQWALNPQILLSSGREADTGHKKRTSFVQCGKKFSFGGSNPSEGLLFLCQTKNTACLASDEDLRLDNFVYPSL